MQSERKEAENQQRMILEETEKRLEVQRENLELLKMEQDIAKENAQKELQDLKLRIQEEHMNEKQKFDEEMQKMVHLNELQQQSVKDQEDSLAKQKVNTIQIIFLLFFLPLFISIRYGLF